MLNIVLLLHIDGNVDYTAALAAGKHWQVALTVLAGPGIANGGLFLLSCFMLANPWFRTRPVAANFLFWFLFMNLANLYDYVPMRVFAADGDVHHFILGSGVDPWVIYVVGGYLVLWAIVAFYRRLLPLGLTLSDFVTPEARGVILVVATVLLFGYFSIPSLIFEPDMASQLIARTSVMAIPPVLLLMWARIATPPVAQPVGRCNCVRYESRPLTWVWHERCTRAVSHWRKRSACHRSLLRDGLLPRAGAMNERVGGRRGQ